MQPEQTPGSRRSDVRCTCDHDESDGRSDVLRCSVHGIGDSEADRVAFDRRTAEARRITSEALPSPRGGEWVMAALHKQLDEMTLHEDLPDSFDMGYMAAIREIRKWAESL